MIRRLMIGLTALMFAASCTTMDQVTGERTPNRTANGAILGALGGAALGTLAGGNDRRNALIGAGVGALAGAAIGNYMDRQYQNLRQRLAGTGVGVERVNESQIKLNFPADLTFDFNRDSVKSGFVPTLSGVANVLSQYPQTTVDVYGFADCTGADAYNQDLSERRAQNVSSVLIQNGVIRQRIAATGFGESRPIAQPCTAAPNRRVEVYISAFQG
ncbi:MAG: OmpA family protein [Terricaulis sp.]